MIGLLFAAQALVPAPPPLPPPWPQLMAPVPAIAWKCTLRTDQGEKQIAGAFDAVPINTAVGGRPTKPTTRIVISGDETGRLLGRNNEQVTYRPGGDYFSFLKGHPPYSLGFKNLVPGAPASVMLIVNTENGMTSENGACSVEQVSEAERGQ